MKKFAFLLIPIITLFAFLGSSYFVSLRFDHFLEQEFISEATCDAITLHYSLEDPSSYGLDTNKLFNEGCYLPSWCKSDTLRSSDALNDLKKYPRFLLNKSQRLEYDILYNYFTLDDALSQYELYSEPLSSLSGTHSELPILLSEFDFYSSEDIDTYFGILKDIPNYLDGIIAFETQKADEGLFMSDRQCIDVINQCEDFENSPLLIDSFMNRINEADFLSESEKESLINQNNTLVEEYVMPAYSKLALKLSSMLGLGRNALGLYYLPEGKDYYELLVQKNTGTSKSVNEIYSEIEEKRTESLATVTEYLSSNSYDNSLSSDIYSSNENSAESSETNMSSLSIDTSMEILESLQLSICDDFPTVDNFCYEVSCVDSCLSEGLAPAFYITPPLDDYKNNKIYINSAADYPDIEFFVTLAHEGFPGHLYQNVMSYELELLPYRCLLDFGGYSEGWATYVEFLSYKYAGIDDASAMFLSAEASATLSLYASTDIGINYYGWDYSATADFWKDYGIDDPDTILSIMDLVIASPANYLKYYVGYLEIENLKSQKEASYDNFSLSSFHKALLDIGPAQFDIIDKYFDDFYCNN